MTREIHEKAMALSFKAMVAEQKGNQNESLRLYKEAYQYELQVFDEALNETPVKAFSVGVLGKSTFWLAYKARLYEEGLQVIERVYQVEGVPHSLILELQECEATAKKAITPAVGCASLTLGMTLPPVSSLGVGYGSYQPIVLNDEIETDAETTLLDIERVFPFSVFNDKKE